MRAGAPDEVLSGSAGWEPRVWSWLGPRLLGAVPVVRGSLAVDVTAAVPQRLTLTAPRYADEIDWYPGDDPEHPLARYGQELQVSIVVSSPLVDPSEGTSEWETRLGRFLITSWEEAEDGSIRVEAVGRLRRLADDQLTAPTQPAPGATLASEARRLMPPGVAVAIDPALVDRPCPSGMSWSADRLSALQEIADAWPARLRTDEWGQVVLAAPLPDIPTPVLTLTTGERGTVVHALRSDTRAGSYNEVVATSSAPGADGVSAVAQVTSGPMAVTGEYGAVTKRWASPLIETEPQAQASARTILDRSVLPTRRLPVTCAPDPRIDIDDPLRVLHGDLEVVRTRALGPVVRRNRVPNPSFEVSTAGVSTTTATTVLLATTARPSRVGSRMLGVEVDSPSSAQYVWQVAALAASDAGRHLAFSALVGRSTGSNYARLSVQFRDAVGAAIGSTTHGPIVLLSNADVVRHSVAAAVPDGAATVRLFLYVYSSATGAIALTGRTLTDAWVAAVADTEAAALAAVETYFDGDTRLPDGHRGRWTGTPGASASELLAPPIEQETYEPSERTWGYVVAYDLPLTVHDGPMRLDLGVST